MKDYGRIITKINQTPWLITPEGLQTVLSIVTERLENGRLSEDELETRLAGLGSRRSSNDDEPTIINGVGILPVQGPIFGKANMMTEFSGATSMEKFQQDFRAMMGNDRVDSILMDFDTPGGTSDLIEEVGQEIYDARGTKPIYSSVNTMCGSAGLWLAMQADKVFSTPSGTVGSLGAYTVHQDQSGADAKNGVKFTYIKAGQYKTEGNPHEPLSPEGIQYRQEQVNELMEGFLSAVARGRNTSVENVRENYGQGRMLTPKNALEVGMIDGIASYDEIVSSAAVSRARPVQVVTPSGEAIAATMIGDKVMFTDEAARFNQAEYDKLRRLVSSGTILDREALGTPAVTLPNPRKEDDTMKLSAEALTALGLSADATDEQIGAAIMAQANELAPLKELRTTIESKKKFADEYPEEYAMMTSLQESNKKLESAAFAKGYTTMRFSDLKVTQLDDGTENSVVEPTTKGLSGLAIGKIEMSVEKINTGSYQLSDFKETLDSIMLGGIVDYGEKGTVTGAPLTDDTVELSSNTLANRTLFSNKVLEVMEKDKVDQDKAIEMVATKHPELWAAYKSPHVHA